MCRFLNGFLDQKAHQQFEFVKNPTNIDDALDEIIKYCETHQTGGMAEDSNGQHHVRGAHTNPVETEDSDASGGSEDEADSCVTCTTKPFHKDKRGQLNVPKEKLNHAEAGKTECPMVTIVQMKNLIAESENNMKELLAQQANNGHNGGPKM